jgi:protein TonB
MTDVIAMDGFDGLLRGVLMERVGVAAPRGLEQRLLARLMQEDERVVAVMPQRFGFAEQVAERRSAASAWFAVGAHAAVLLVLVGITSVRVMSRKDVGKTVASVEVLTPPRVLQPRFAAGGGGGQPDHAPVTQGHLPKFAPEQLLVPKAPPKVEPQLAVEPTVVVSQDLRMADNAMPDMGSPTLAMKGRSLGNGTGGGVGSGNGNGVGPGSGVNMGGGIAHGLGITPPVPLKEVEPEFSEEARKAKFSGNVEVYLVVDEQGRPTNVRVARGVGMGLDEKAMEAVRQYKFKPGTQNGKPVKVEMYVQVEFNIF